MMKRLLLALSLLAVPATASDVYLHAALSKGMMNSQGITTETVGICVNGWCLDAERFGGEATTTMVYAAGYKYTPGWRPFGVQPLVYAGVSYAEDLIFVPNARQYRPLISERQAFQLGLGARFGEYVELWWTHDSTGGREAFDDPFSANTGIDRLRLVARAPL